MAARTQLDSKAIVGLPEKKGNSWAGHFGVWTIAFPSLILVINWSKATIESTDFRILIRYTSSIHAKLLCIYSSILAFLYIDYATYLDIHDVYIVKDMCLKT